jgi:sulfide:quinone oxidoreductase
VGKRIVVLGGGTGGLVVANRLRKALTKDNDVILIDKEKNHLFSPSLLWLMVGWRGEEKIQKPLSLLQKKGIRFINALVQKIDFENRIVFTSQGDVSFDYLVITLGASTFPEKIPSFLESAYNLYDLEGTKKIREKIANFDKGRLVVLITSTPFKCPAAPYEAALILSAYFTKRRRDVEIEVFTPEPLPMPVAGPEIGNMVVSLLQSREIRFTPQYQVVKIDPAKKEAIFQDEKTLSYDLLIGIPPHGLPSVLKDSPILGESGWVKVNPRTLETVFENVYALGDVTAIPLPVGRLLPKAGVFAHFQAEVVAHNIAAKINGMSSKKEFNGRGYCFIELGDGRAAYASGNFYAEPRPVVDVKKPSVLWHWGKVLFEKWWLWRWF